jgi:hypothetical protein
MGPDQLFESHCELWPLVVPSWLTCVVLSGFTLARLTIDFNLRSTLENG